jgi:hypothetical protein
MHNWVKAYRAVRTEPTELTSDERKRLRFAGHIAIDLASALASDEMIHSWTRGDVSRRNSARCGGVPVPQV